MPDRVTLTWCQGWKRPWQRLRRRGLPLPAASLRSAQTSGVKAIGSGGRRCCGVNWGRMHRNGQSDAGGGE